MTVGADVMEEASSHVTASNCEAVSMLLPNIPRLIEISDHAEKENIMHKILDCCDAFTTESAAQLKCLHFMRSTLQRQSLSREEDDLGQACTSVSAVLSQLYGK